MGVSDSLTGLTLTLPTLPYHYPYPYLLYLPLPQSHYSHFQGGPGYLGIAPTGPFGVGCLGPDDPVLKKKA